MLIPWHLHVNACQYYFWNAVTFGAAKFQVDIKEVGGRGVWPKRPVVVKRGKSEYVDRPLVEHWAVCLSASHGHFDLSLLFLLLFILLYHYSFLCWASWDYGSANKTICRPYSTICTLAPLGRKWCYSGHNKLGICQTTVTWLYYYQQ